MRKYLLVFLVIVLSLSLMIGCSSSDNQLNNVGQNGDLRVNVSGVKADSSNDSSHTLIQKDSEKVEIEVKNLESEQVKSNNKQLENNDLKFAFKDLEVGAKYEISVKVKDASGNIIYKIDKTSTAITEETITEVEVDLQDQQVNSKEINDLAITNDQTQIYYKRGYDTPYIHYAVNGTWTDAPGVEMEDSEYEGYSVITIDLEEASELEACFNDGTGNWDSNGGNNYNFSAGVSTFEEGNITEGTPDSEQESNKMTVYYKRGYNTPYIHYSVNGTWTEVPGVEMEDSEYEGYSVITIDLEEASELEACFNDGTGNWDSNGGNNYVFSAETVTFEDGNITEGNPVGEPVTGVSLEPTTLSLTVGNTEQLAATVSPSDATNKDVTWSSSDEDVLTVVDGTLTAEGAGSATVTVTTEDGEYTATCDVEVTSLSDEGEIDLDIDWETAPAAPDNLSTDISGNAVTLEWDRVDQDLAADDSTKEFGGYYIYRSTEEGELGTAVQSDLIEDNSYIDEDVEAGETYYYQLRAYGGNSGYLAGDFSEVKSITY
ncbi:MAG: carbohydrate binding domain-containing protein [Bacillota bacterium]